MGLLLQTLLFFCCWMVPIVAGMDGMWATDNEWRSAMATYSRGTDVLTSTDSFLVVSEGGACGYRDLSKSDYGANIAGLSTALFERGRACGGCYQLRCVDHILWCLPGSPSVVVTATDFCAPNYGLPRDYGGWCNYPNEHFELSEYAFTGIAERVADIVPVQYRRVKCEREGGMRFSLIGSTYFVQVLISNVGGDGEVAAVKVKGSRTGWIPMGRNWGQNWQCNADLSGQPLAFEVSSGWRTAYNVAPSNWQFGQAFEGKQFQQ